MHAFDRDAVTGPITVRLAREGERLTTLDGTTRKLTTDDLLITDETGPIGMAAVMGGASTEIGDGTTAVLLEAAHWEPTGVARTARRHRLPSEAAKRFERGVDPEMTVVALARAAELLAEYGGATVVGGAGRRRHPRPAADDRPRRRQACPGRRRALHAPRQVVELLGAVGCDVDASGNPLAVTPPPWRPDLTDPADLIEEVVRLAGYDDIPSVLPDGAARARDSPTCSAAGAASAARWPRPGTSRRRPTRSSGRRRWTPWACPTTTRAVPSSSSGTRCRRRSRRCARRCCPACWRPWPATSPAGSATSPCSSTARCSPAASAHLRRCRAWTGRPDDETLAALLGAVPEQPWHVAVALTGNREPRGWWGPGRAGGLGRRRAGRAARGRGLGCRDHRARGGAGALAPGPLRGAARRRPRGRPRRRAAPPGVRGPRAAGAHVGHGAGPRRAAGGRRCRSARPSRASRRCSSTWRSS